MTTPTCYGDGAVYLYCGDCIDVMRTYPDASVDAIVTDPPYGLGFMGKAWDDLPPGEEWARECLRVLKPGGHILAFGGSRTWHRLAVAVEDAGFEIRDSIAWLYGSGFPKSLDVSKAIDKAAGAERPVVGMSARHGGGVVGNGSSYEVSPEVPMLTAPATPDAAKWQGWGTALKPAFEPIVVGRKPLVGTVAANVLAHGVGAFNIDATRIAMPEGETISAPQSDPTKRAGEVGADLGISGSSVEDFQAAQRASIERTMTLGRWPANVILDDEAAALLDEQSGTLKSGANPTNRSSDKFRDAYGDFAGQAECTPARGADKGGASRFFPTFPATSGNGADAATFLYCAKAPTKERVKVDGVAHPTVKPLALMRWLLKLVTPPGGVVLDPFAGSGTTLEAAVLEGVCVVGIEREASYLPLIEARLARQGLVAAESLESAA